MFINPFSVIGYMYSGILKWSSGHLGRLCTFEFMVCIIMSPECYTVLSFHKDIAFSALRPGLTPQGKKIGQRLNWASKFENTIENNML
jgi:hypothetical protein